MESFFPARSFEIIHWARERAYFIKQIIIHCCQYYLLEYELLPRAALTGPSEVLNRAITSVSTTWRCTIWIRI